MQVHLLSKDKENDWDVFVNECDDATFFHLAGWRTVLEKAFSHKTYYFYAESNNQIVGVLPLARVRSMIFGDHLISLPFAVYGGAIAVDDNVKSELINAACNLAKELNVEDLEIRNITSFRSEWPRKDLYVRFRKEISTDIDVNMKEIPRKQRAMVRKGIKAGLEGVVDNSVDRIYGIYSESVRNLGTPVFSKNYLQVLKEVFSESCEVLMITHEGRDIAGVMSFYFKDQVLPYYGGSIESARALKANDFMYWDLMCRASAKGARIFDYGRSKVGSGAYSFKKNWGFEPEPLNYEYYLVNAKEMPQLNPNNPKYKYFINTWKKLPVSISNRLGPYLAKSLG
jgi:FemAB-related protein (PEP-CTERM system-associated)